MSDVAIAVLGVLAASVTGGGILTVVVKNRAARPSGWQVAVNGLTDQVADLKVRVGHAESRAEAAEAKAEEVVAENHGLKATIGQQIRSMDALNGRIVQLLSSWPPGSRPPSPNPAHEPYL